MAEDKTKGKLRIRAGAGQGYEVDGEVASRYSGRSVIDALTGIIQETDSPEMPSPSMLREPRLALELYGQDEGGEYQEVPLSPTEQWDRVLKQLEENDVEVGIARSHAGGSHRRNERPGRSRALAKRFPRQQVTTHPGDHDLTDDERAEVRNGRAVFFVGSVLAKVECICQELGGQEALWYYVALPTERDVVRDVIIPEQTGSSGHCRVDGNDVLKAGRLAWRRGMMAVGMGHSHGWMGVFSSGTDRDQMTELASERIGKITIENQTIQGTVRRVQSENDQAAAFEVGFPDSTTTMLLQLAAVNSRKAELRPEDLTVDLNVTRHRMMCFFSTHNSHRKHMVPMLSVSSCRHCGSTYERHIDPPNIVVHIVGPIKISKEEKSKLRKEVKKKVKRYSWYQYGSGSDSVDGDASVAIGPTGDTLSDSPNDYAPDADVAEEPAPFHVYRRGNLVAKISAATLEHAAAETPALAVALGWESPRTQADLHEETANAQ